MKIFENGQFVEMLKEHKIYQLIEAAKARIKTAEQQGGDKNE